MSRFDGSPFELDSRETLASNGLVHDALVREFQEIFAGTRARSAARCAPVRALSSARTQDAAVQYRLWERLSAQALKIEKSQVNRD